MPDYPRELPHLYLRASGQPEPFTSKLSGRDSPLPERDRLSHAESLATAMAEAVTAAQVRRTEREPGLAAGTSGFYLDFEIPPGSESAAERLENKPKQIELVAFRALEDGPAIATVFVPDSAVTHFGKKIEAYRDQNKKSGRPKNEDLIARINSIRLAAVQSLYTDDPNLFPQRPDLSVWWEAWVRRGHADAFDDVANRMEFAAQPQRLVFPDREVRLLYSDVRGLARLYLNSNSIAELRLAKDTPALFVSWSNVEQAEWATDLANRVVLPNRDGVSVCILDTGVTQGHPLLAPALRPGDVHKYEPTWRDGDTRGHGTQMAGTALYGDLKPLLEGDGPVSLSHYLESVKILPDEGENEPRLYGAITSESIARAEIAAPDRRRAVCLAITSDIGTNRGRPSSWSAAIDQLCFDDAAGRLILISAGNVRPPFSKSEYPSRNELESIENPAQAWNAITVGAFTEKANLVDPSFAGWKPVAAAGELCPTSRTSLPWEQQWPIKPDIVMEGGNLAASGDECDSPDDLGLLTTQSDLMRGHFDIFGDTSAATAMAGNLAGRILAAMPERWPETIRALMVHSAEWTTPMQQEFDGAPLATQKLSLLRKYGYGVPSYERAVRSALNDFTLIAEDRLYPLKKGKSGGIKTHQMNLHTFPWPRTELEQLGETEVELRVTLSYYIEPNPGERGWIRRHRYRSHALRFDVKRALESVDEFRSRINKRVSAEEEGVTPTASDADRWYLGRARDRGSIHSDYWRGSAIDLAKRSAIGVFPVGGWWKENPSHERYALPVRYALIVSIRAVNGGVDIYTPVRLQIESTVEITN